MEKRVDHWGEYYVLGPTDRCETHSFVTRAECGCDERDRCMGVGFYVPLPPGTTVVTPA